MDKFILGDSKIPTRACLSSSAANLELVLKAREKAPEASELSLSRHKTKSASTDAK